MAKTDLSGVLGGISIVCWLTAGTDVGSAQRGQRGDRDEGAARPLPAIQIAEGEARGGESAAGATGAVGGLDRGYEGLVETSFAVDDLPALGGAAPPPESGGAIVTGTRETWQPLTLSWTGPFASELDVAPNPFLDYRLVAVFTGPSGQQYEVPGFFDGDGAGGAVGDVWRVRFAPDEAGAWQYEALFHEGPELAVDLDLSNGTALAFHGDAGSVNVLPVERTAPGFYRWGRVEYVGEHYLKFRDGGYFLKGGVDSPENLLGYAGFDNTWDQAGGANTAGLTDGLHRFAPHVAHFGPSGLGDAGDPYFVSADTGYDSKGIVGAINYLSRVGVNSVYFLPMNMGGDGRETAPFTGFENTHYDKTHYDISKLAQWNMVFEHAQRRKLLLHVVLGETESGNEQWLDGGTLGVERKLFYREMSARFGHVPALKWNLSEESDFSVALVRSFADYLRQVDPYDHPIAFHTHLLQSNGEYADYEAMLGDPRLEMTSIQCAPQAAHGHVEKWRAKSAASGHKWVVDIDEISPSSTGLTDSNAIDLRKKTLYPVYFSGGNIEWYLGYHSLPLGGDMRLEDFSTRQEMWIYMRFARRFMESYVPFWKMQPADGLVTGEDPAYGGAQVLAEPGEVYAVYYPNTSSTGTIDLSGASGTFTKMWYDPRLGVPVGALETVQGGGKATVGFPPDPAGGASGVFLEQNGLLVMEVESAQLAGQWVSETLNAGYAGLSYYRWNGPDLFNSPGEGILRWDFAISKPGTYDFRIHNRHDHPEPDQENDCWVRLDGGPWVKVFSNKGAATVKTWNWESNMELSSGKPPASYQLSSGVHTLEISGRSKNFMMDRLHLYDSSVSNPLTISHPESAKGTGGGTAPSNEDWVLLLKK